jgi:hypothetical protein
MITYNLFFIIYFLIIIIQIILTKYIIKNNISTDDIDYNKTHEDELQHIFTNTIDKYGDLIESGNISTNEWIKIVRDNQFIKIDKFEYYIFIFEKIPHVESYIYKVYPIKEYENLYNRNVIYKVNQEIVNETHEIPKNFNEILQHTALSVKNKSTFIEYFWINLFNKTNTIKKSYIKHWKNPNDNREGVIGLGYEILSISKESSYKYFDYLNKGELIFISLVVFFTSLLIFKLKTKYYITKSLTFLIIINIFITFYINSYEIMGSVYDEKTKLSNIDSNVLNMAFLTGINMFILKMIYIDLDHITLFIETAIIFSVSIILLLLASYKFSSKNRIENILQNRISAQIVFNTAISFNILILINFIIYSFFTKSKRNNTFI